MRKIIIGLILVALAGTALAVSATLGKAEKMQSAVKEDRQACAQDILAERQALLGDLMSIAETETAAKGTWTQASSGLNDTVYLLGEFRSEEAVPVLVQNLWPQPNQECVVTEFGYSPAAKALGRIGVAGARAVLEEMKRLSASEDSWGSPEVDQRMIVCCGVLIDVYTQPVAMAVLEIEIQGEKDPLSKAALQKGLDWMKSRD